MNQGHAGLQDLEALVCRRWKRYISRRDESRGSEGTCSPGPCPKELGETGSVHLDRIEGGSTVLVHEIEPAARPSIENRIRALREGSGPLAARGAVQKMNDYLAEDDAKASLYNGDTDSRLFAFPGRTESGDNLRSPRQRGTVSGVIVRVGGRWREDSGIASFPRKADCRMPCGQGNGKRAGPPPLRARASSWGGPVEAWRRWHLWN